MVRSRRNVILGFVAIIALVILFPVLVGTITDWWWFQEIGYQVVFSRSLAMQLMLVLGIGGVTAGILYLNLRIAQRGIVINPVILAVGPASPKLDLTRAIRRVSLPVVLVLALFAAVGAT